MGFVITCLHNGRDTRFCVSTARDMFKYVSRETFEKYKEALHLSYICIDSFHVKRLGVDFGQLRRFHVKHKVVIGFLDTRDAIRWRLYGDMEIYI